MNGKPAGAGKSSLDLVDQNRVFSLLDVDQGASFLDLACGFGKYSLALSKFIGEQGVIYAVDLWEDGIASLNEQIEENEIKNIKPLVSDISKKIPLAEDSVDTCLLATAMHDLPANARPPALDEIWRVLRPEGSLSIIEFKKLAEGPGPPLEIRLNEDEVESLVVPHGFTKICGESVGLYHYLVKFRKVCGRARR